MNATLAKRLRAALDEIDRPGSFCTTGSVPLLLPGLEVAGLGTIALPLTAGQAKELRAVCEQAPYGKGTETLVDTSVRRVWRLTPDRFELTNPAWAGLVNDAVAAAQEGLGLGKQKLEAHLYDLLLYEKGSFFLPHRDGEKLDRMVATLVIVLPSVYTGGELIVRHAGQKEVVDCSATAKFQTNYAAFYADCEHEVRPLLSGQRLCLVYNLTLAKSKGKKGIAAPDWAEQTQALTAVLRDGSKDEDASKVVLLLDHEYTEAGLTWDALKGVDRTRAQALLDATQAADWNIYLAQVTFHEVGSAEEDGGWGYGGYDRYEEDEEDEESEDTAGDHEMLEVMDSDLTANHWRDRDGNAVALGAIDIEEDELLDPDSLRAVKPREEYEGFTGNAGATLDRWYRHGAILLWPAAQHFAVLCDAGRPASLGALEQLTNQWQKAKGKAAESLRGQVREFAVAILDSWTPSSYPSSYLDDFDDFDDEYDDAPPARKSQPTACPLAHALARLEDADLIRTYLTKVLAEDASVDPGAALAAIGKKLGWGSFRTELEGVFAKTTRASLARNARLLESLCTATPGKQSGWKELCASLARAAVAALQRIDADTQPYYGYTPPRDKLLAGLARALLSAGQAEQLGRVVTHTLEQSTTYPLREVHLAALTELRPWLKKHVKEPSAELSDWVAAVRTQFERLTAQEPQPPTDFARPAEVPCKCALCGELRRFLANPKEETHRFSRPEADRSHLEHRIRDHKCDLDCRTEKKGRPYTLIVTKNTASYKAALKLYHADQKRLAEVQAIEAALP